MAQEPYRSAHRAFWIFVNGSSHRGEKADQRLQSRWPSLIPVHTPVHASWLNQVEICFSIHQRKVLTPSDFSNLTGLEMALLAFQYRYGRATRRCLSPKDYVTVIPNWGTEDEILAELMGEHIALKKVLANSDRGLCGEEPLGGDRRRTFMRLDANLMAVSPARKPPRKGTGFEQPPAPRQHRHLDVSQIK